MPAALRRSFFMAMGPMLARWSDEGAVMIWSQMTAWCSASLAHRPAVRLPHSAVT